MHVRLHVVVSSEDPAVIESVKEHLLRIFPGFSCSPAREQASLNNCSEFYATASCTPEEARRLYETLNNDFDGEEDDCSAYGFNTKMFDPDVYYLQMETYR